jgi:hypothetical protein
MRPVSEQTVAELHNKCWLPAGECRVAVGEHGGDLDAALAALIDAGRVKSDALNPDTVPLDLFERAARRQKLEMYRKFTAQLGEKTPEQMLEEEEKKHAQRIEVAREAGLPKADMRAMSWGEQARFSAQTRRRIDRLEKNPYTLELPPFPRLKREMHEWTGKGLLTAWAGTQARQGPYTSESSDAPSNGSFTMKIPRLGADDAYPARLTSKWRHTGTWRSTRRKSRRES